ncbi:MAG: purine-nucleoside phosphorylase [Chitinophagales bacterium]|nr:purine-nucleoside phosphorylase [Chitinophagales bacterium]
MFDKIQATKDHILSKGITEPQVGIVLGSGLGSLTALLTDAIEVDYSEIPNFPQSTVQGHKGKLIYGKLSGKNVLMMAGRFHYYEGYNMSEVTFPIRVMKALGVTTLILSNAAGGMNPNFKVGDIMLIKDHINFFPEHPLRGHNDEKLGPRFPDMSEPYDKNLLKVAEEKAAASNIKVQKGIYAGVQGPTYETPAEYDWLHRSGADAVGMSTVPEVIVAKHSGMNAFAMSVITDLGVAGLVETITHEEVLEAANKAAPNMAKLVTELVAAL